MIPDTRCGKLLFYFLPSTELFAFEGRYSFFEKEREREREKHLRSPSRSIVENKISNQSIVLCVEKFFLFFNFSSPRGGKDEHNWRNFAEQKCLWNGIQNSSDFIISTVPPRPRCRLPASISRGNKISRSGECPWNVTRSQDGTMKKNIDKRLKI